MSLLFKILPAILLIVIFYYLVYNLYPKYQELISLSKKINEMQNELKELESIELAIQSMAQNANIQQLINNKEVLDLWLPQEPKLEELLASVVGIYGTTNIVFKGTDFEILNETKSYNPNILPLKVIKFKLTANLTTANLLSFLEGLEKNVRLMVIKRAEINRGEPSNFEVESYYLSQK
jgi:hypothetical protein